MSGANSIHGVVVIGALLVTSTAHGVFGYAIAFVAVAFAAMNVVGGYAVTDRMLEMFKARPVSARRRPARRRLATGTPRLPTSAPMPRRRTAAPMSGTETVVRLVFLAAASCFVIGLHLMNSPRTARRGNTISMIAMACAILATIVLLAVENAMSATGWVVAAAGFAVGGGHRSVRGPNRQDDRDTATGQPFQRRGWRRGGAAGDP